MYVFSMHRFAVHVRIDDICFVMKGIERLECAKPFVMKGIERLECRKPFVWKNSRECIMHVYVFSECRIERINIKSRL